MATGEAGKADASSALTDTTPFGVPSVQGTKSSAGRKLPGSPRVADSAEAQPARSTTQTQSAMDHKRAFQAVNAETLELALQDIDYEMPPHKVSLCSDSIADFLHCTSGRKASSISIEAFNLDKDT